MPKKNVECAHLSILLRLEPEAQDRELSLEEAEMIKQHIAGCEICRTSRSPEPPPEQWDNIRLMVDLNDRGVPLDVARQLVRTLRDPRISLN
jgi:hypothetical protein